MEGRLLLRALVAVVGVGCWVGSGTARWRGGGGGCGCRGLLAGIVFAER